VLQYSDDLDEAVDIICQADRTTGWILLLGDGKNLNAAAVETSDNYCQVYWAGDPAEDIGPFYSIPDAVRRTNTYVNPDYGCGRYEALSELILAHYGNITADMSIEFLPVVGGSCQSEVFDATDLELWVANTAYEIPASQQEFLYVSRNDLFPQCSLTISSTAGGNVTTPGEGAFIYDRGTVVNLTAAPDNGHGFADWTGNVSTIAGANNAATTIVMDGDYFITANFESVANGPTVCGGLTSISARRTVMDEVTQILAGILMLVSLPVALWARRRWVHGNGCRST
jgi:hypothetical protein